MHVVRFPSLAFQNKYFLYACHNGTGFAVRHYLPDNLTLCGATFLIRSLVDVLILPISHKDLKWLLFLNLPLLGRGEY